MCICLLLSCINTLPLKESTRIHTHTHSHGFTPLASHHNHVIHLTHTCTPTRSDTFGFVSLWVSHKARLSVWMKSVFPQHSCDHALRIFLFLLLSLFPYKFCGSFLFLSPASSLDFVSKSWPCKQQRTTLAQTGNPPNPLS